MRTRRPTTPPSSTPSSHRPRGRASSGAVPARAASGHRPSTSWATSTTAARTPTSSWALRGYHSLDIQWGNRHRVDGCLARPARLHRHVVRNCARYSNLSILEDAYGASASCPLTHSFALDAYADDLRRVRPEERPKPAAAGLEMNVRSRRPWPSSVQGGGKLIDLRTRLRPAGYKELLDKIDYERAAPWCWTAPVRAHQHGVPTVGRPTLPADAREKEIMQRLETGVHRLRSCNTIRFFLEAEACTRCTTTTCCSRVRAAGAG